MSYPTITTTVTSTTPAPTPGTGPSAGLETATELVELPEFLSLAMDYLWIRVDTLLGGSGHGMNLYPDTDPTVAADALNFLLGFLGGILADHAHGCAAGSPQHIAAAVHEHMCRDCAPRRDLNHAMRVGRRGGDFYVQQMLAKADYWLNIVALATASSLSLTDEDPHAMLEELEALLHEHAATEGQPVS